MPDFLIVPYVKLFPNKITYFERPDNVIFSEKQKETHENLKDNTNRSNDLSENSRRRLKEKIDIMIFRAEVKKITGRITKNKNIETEILTEKKEKYKNPIWFKLSMITITLSSKQSHSDIEIKTGLLNPFLKELNRKFNVKNYIWKAEKQENGNIHFHIIIDKYIKHQEIRSIWNRIQNLPGFEYVNKFRKNQKEFYHNGFRYNTNSEDSPELQQKKYQKKVAEDFKNPNSTDVHSLKYIRKTAAYLAEYMTKGVTNTLRLDVMRLIENEVNAITKYIKKVSPVIINYINDKEKIKKINEILSIQSERLNVLNENFNYLKRLGVTGRIYGLSRNLSKLKNPVICSEFHNIPDIEIIQKIKTFEKITPVKNNEVRSIWFDSKKTPEYYNFLSNSYELCVNDL